MDKRTTKNDRCSVSSKRTFLASRQGYVAEKFLFGDGCIRDFPLFGGTVRNKFPARKRWFDRCAPSDIQQRQRCVASNVEADSSLTVRHNPDPWSSMRPSARKLKRCSSGASMKGVCSPQPRGTTAAPGRARPLIPATVAQAPRRQESEFVDRRSRLLRRGKDPACSCERSMGGRSEYVGQNQIRRDSSRPAVCPVVLQSQMSWCRADGCFCAMCLQ